MGGFIKIRNLKLGNMRKAQDWTVIPLKDMVHGIIVAQSANRIVRINTTTGKAMLSDGKGGHQGFAKLSPDFGAVTVDVPQDDLERIKEATVDRHDYHGAVNVTSLANGGLG